MKQYRIVINEFAENDIRTSIKWYNSQLENLGNEFVYEIDQTIRLIQLNPKTFSRIKKEMRRAIIKDFLMAYFILFKVILSIFLLLSTLAEVLKYGNKG